MAVEEVGVVGEEGGTGGEFDGERAECLGGAEFGADGPAVSAEVHKAGGIVLAGGHGDGEARAKDEVLLVVTEFLQVHRRGTVEVDGALDACVGEAVDGALDRLAGEDGIAAEPAVGGNDVDLGGLTPEIEDVAIAEQRR